MTEKPLDIAGEEAMPKHNDLSATGFYSAAVTLGIAIIGGWLALNNSVIRLQEQVVVLNQTVLSLEISVKELDRAVRPFPNQQATMFVPDATRVLWQKPR